MEESIGKKDLETGIIFVPYIMVETNPIVSYSIKKTIRKNKINKVYNLGLNTLSSRYSKKLFNNNFYGVL